MSLIRHFPGLWLADNKQPRPLIGCWLSVWVSLSHLPHTRPVPSAGCWPASPGCPWSLHHWQRGQVASFVKLCWGQRHNANALTLHTLSTKMRISFLNTFPLFSGSSSLPQTRPVPSAGCWPASPGSASSLRLIVVSREKNNVSTALQNLVSRSTLRRYFLLKSTF